MSTSPPESSMPPPGRKSNGAARPSQARWAGWGVAAVVVLAMLLPSGAVYWWHKKGLQRIAWQHVRLMVTGPSALSAGVAAAYSVRTTTVAGDPLPAEIQVALQSTGGLPLLDHKERSHPDGRLDVVLPTDPPITSGAALRVAAVHGDVEETVETRLVVEPTGCMIHLATDRSRYRPGETVYFRSLLLGRFHLAAERDLPIRFELLDPGGAVVPGSVLEGVTERGVGNGVFAIPEGAPAGRYVLVVRSEADVFPDQRCPFLVGQDRLLPPDEESKSETESESKSDPADDGHGPGAAVAVTFYPEGGELVARLENRVYFVSRDPLGEPVAVTGTVVDDRGQEVASVATARAGMGSFAFIPESDREYRLWITNPAEAGVEPRLPEVSGRHKIVLGTGTGVFGAGQPIEFNVRAASPGMPLVAAAYCRGVLVGQQTLVTAVDPQTKIGSNSVAIAVPDDVGGVIRLTVYDASASPPRGVAERLVYRRMARGLKVDVVGAKAAYAPGEHVELSLIVTNEKGEPVPAVLGVAVGDCPDSRASENGTVPLDAATATMSTNVATTPADGRRASMTTDFLLGSEIERPEDLADADFYLSDGAEAEAALDLLLGTQGWRRFAAKTLDELRSTGGDENLVRRLTALGDLGGPPAVFDNLPQIEPSYQELLVEFETLWGHAADVLLTLCLLAALALLLLVVMMGLLKIVSGVHFWIPAMLVGGCCALLGVALLDTARSGSAAEEPTAFAPYYVEATPSEPTADDQVASPDRSEEQGGLKDLAELEKRVDDEDARHGLAQLRKGLAASLQQYRFTVRDYAHEHVAGEADAASDRARTLFWAPMRTAGADGRATIAFDLPDSPGVFHLRVDANGDGRIGCGEIELILK